MNNQEYHQQYLSKCCSAPMKDSGDMNTGFWICSKCEKPCDPKNEGGGCSGHSVSLASVANKLMKNSKEPDKEITKLVNENLFELIEGEEDKQGWDTKLNEAGDLHSPGCCINDQFGCDTDVKLLECCDNMVFITSVIRQVEKEAEERIKDKLFANDYNSAARFLNNLK